MHGLPRSRPAARGMLAAALATAVAVAGCGRGSDTSTAHQPRMGARGDDAQAARDLGFPGFATKNTTRVGGADPIADAAAVARAVYSGASPATRPAVVTLVDARDWRAALAASALMAPPLRAPVLFADGRDGLPAATANALTALAPTGAKQAGDGQVVRIGRVPRPKGLRTTDIVGTDPFLLARAVDAFQAAARGRAAGRVLVVSADDPAFAMPAAAWAAKSGDPILFVHRGSIPEPTRIALAGHQHPNIYVLGPPAAVSARVVTQLRRLGRVTRIAGDDPVRNAIAFARFSDGTFGWGVIDPGHGLVVTGTRRTADAAAAAPLSAAGMYGPLLLTSRPGTLDPPLEQYLMDIQPGYTSDPTRGVYNHAWIVGDDSTVSIGAQSRIDSLLEIVPVNQRSSPSS